MKNFKIILIFLTLSLGLSIHAQDGNNNNNNQNNSGSGSSITRCLAQQDQRDENGKPKISPDCKAMYVISAMFEKPLSETSTKQSWNRTVSCRRAAGFTLDYDDCSRTLDAYNGVITVEQTLFAGQTISQTNNIKENQTATDKAIKEGGDLQAAAIAATKSHQEHLARLNQDQANTYYLAFTTLGGFVSSWQGQAKRSNKRHCKEDELKKIQTSQALQDLGLEVKSMKKEECLVHLERIRKDAGSLAFANNQALSFFIRELVSIGKKAAEAQVRAGNNAKAAQILDKLDPNNDPDFPAQTLDRCVIVPIPKDCIVHNGGHEGVQFQGADIAFGSGGTNVFGADNSSPDSNDINPSLNPTKEGDRISDVASPFQDEAIKASGILDPASAANVTPGSASSAPGGGGGGGGGGGSPPGGSDLKSASETEKSGDTKSTAFKASYGSGGGAKFNKVGEGKDADNPFSSLFDKSSSGGVEEDRSIASQDISDSSLGLFDKISKKYGQVNSDKRIQSNLD